MDSALHPSLSVMPLLSYDIFRVSGRVSINTHPQLEGMTWEEGYPTKPQEKRAGHTCEGERRGEARKHEWASSLFENHQWAHLSICLNTNSHETLNLGKGFKRTLVRQGRKMYAVAKTPSLDLKESCSQSLLFHLSLLEVHLQNPAGQDQV